MAIVRLIFCISFAWPQCIFAAAISQDSQIRCDLQINVSLQQAFDRIKEYYINGLYRQYSSISINQ